MSNDSLWIRVLRWIAVIPALILAYVVAIWLFYFGLNTVIPMIATEVRFSDGFEGHYLLGPLITFGSFAVATFFAVTSSLRTAPAHKGYTAIFLSIPLLMFIVAGSIGVGLTIAQGGINYEQLTKGSIQIVGHIAGFGLAVYSEVFEQKSMF